MSCLPQTRPTVFLRIKTIKATNAVQMLYSISTSKLHHTSGQWCIVTSNVLLFNIIIMHCLSHNLLCSFTINSLHKKNNHKHPPALICHASVGTASQTSYICYLSSWVTPARQKCVATICASGLPDIHEWVVYGRVRRRSPSGLP